MSIAFTAETTIAKPATEVWAALVDWDNATEWMPGIDDFRADGPTEVGATLAFHARGKERPATIAALEPGRSIVLRSVQGGVSADYRYDVKILDDSTTSIALVADCTTTGAWRLLAPMLRFAMRKTDGRQLDRLKDYIEA